MLDENFLFEDLTYSSMHPENETETPNPPQTETPNPLQTETQTRDDDWVDEGETSNDDVELECPKSKYLYDSKDEGICFKRVEHSEEGHDDDDDDASYHPENEGSDEGTNDIPDDNHCDDYVYDGVSDSDHGGGCSRWVWFG